MNVFRRFRAAALVLLSFALFNCGGGGGSDSGDSPSTLTLGEVTVAGKTDGTGRVSFSFTIPAGSTSFQLVGTSPVGVLRLVSLTNPQGIDVASGSTDATAQSVDVASSPSTVSFPFFSAQVVPGAYEAVYRLANVSGDAAHDVSLTVLYKSDADVSSGTLRVNLVLVGPVGGNDELQGDLDAVLDNLRIIYGRANISLDAQWYIFDGPSTIPDPTQGDAFYGSISAAVRPHAVNVVFGTDVRGLTSNGNRYGRAGATPGPAIPSARSAIALSILKLTGGDGQFNDNADRHHHTNNNQHFSLVSDDEVRLGAEEVGRLIARYLGLENEVEFNGGRIVATDSLTDTASCLNTQNCEEQGSARANLMMPVPLVDRHHLETPDQQFYAREEISAQQSRVLNNSVLVQ